MYSIQKIVEALEWKFLNETSLESTIQHLLLDSRQVTFPDTALFFALKGKRHDGHDFIENVYAKGVRNFVISRKIEWAPFPDANFILVHNVVAALQKLAAYHRHQFNLRTIGITGSNGKTIVKEWLFQLLQSDFNIVRSPKSYNSQIGVPLSVWQIQKHHDLGIFEAGISERGEMEKSSPVLNCEIGIFTNIGPAHDEGFSSTNAKIEEKLKLFEKAKTIVYCKNYRKVDEAIQGLKNKNLFCWAFEEKSISNDVALLITKTEKLNGSTTINGTFSQEQLKIQIPFTDSASIENAIHCWATLLFLGYENAIIQNRMTALEPIAMRLELKEGINNCIVINDSYNSDLASLSIALNFLNQQGKNPKRTLFLSDILQTGQEPKQLYYLVAQLLSEKGIDKVIGIGNEVAILESNLPERIQSSFFENTQSFLHNFEPVAFQNETILLKGARKFGFERIARRLTKRTHQTTLEVNLGALIHNLSVYKSFLKPETKIMAMVKASAYGSGSVEVAKLLEFHNVDYLGVAYADEGVELRKAGVQLPIMVMNPEAATFETLTRFDLEPEIYSLGLLRQFSDYVDTENAKVKIHLKVDTGMHRLGFESDELSEVSAILKLTPGLKVASIISHLAGSEDQQHDDFTKLQVSRFEKNYQSLIEKLDYQPLKHILNSTGIVRFPQYQMDMVRLGIGLYGIDSSVTIQEALQVVTTFKATISQIKSLDAKETVGYGRSGKIDEQKRIATISVGYADGLLRAAGNGNFRVLIHNQPAPIIGNVCMDMSMVDVSDIPQAKEGDEVIVFGKTPTVSDLADCLDTIPYEIFTNISKRVKRVYFQE